MDSAGYAALGRQAGLLREMKVVANNIANMSTTGFKREGVVFAEMVRALPVEGGSVSMAAARVRATRFDQGALRRTGGTFDVAIEGEGFFQVLAPAGPRLTRAGAFRLDAAGALVTATGDAVLDSGGAPVLIPPGGGVIEIGADGSISVDGAPVGAIGIVRPEDATTLVREDGVLFRAEGAVAPAEGAIVQGFVEDANAEPVEEMARMIEIQRAYELGQKILDREDERIRDVVRTLGRTA